MITNMNRRDLLATGAAAMLLSQLGAGPAQAQTIDELAVLIGFTPGGGTDRSARIIAPTWAQEAGVRAPVSYEYAEGAGGIIAIQKMLSAPPRERRALANITVLQFIVWNVLLKQGGYERDDIAFLGGYISDPNVILVKKDSPFDSIESFISHAQNNEMTVSVTAAMSPSHAATAVLRERTGAKLRVVPFDGGSAARNAVAGGHVDMCIAPYWAALHVLDLTKGLAIFAEENPAPTMWTPAPINEALGIDLPHLTEVYVFTDSARAREAFPERHLKMVEALKSSVTAPSVMEAAKNNQNLDLFMNYMSPENCVEFFDDYMNLLGEYQNVMEADLDTF